MQYKNSSYDIFRIKVICSKGTYIRTLCVDIGEKLGSPAHMSYLQRVETDSIKKEQTVTFQEIVTAQESGTLQNLLIPIEKVLSHLEALHVDEPTKQTVHISKSLQLSNEMYIYKYYIHLI